MTMGLLALAFLSGWRTGAKRSPLGNSDDAR